MSGYISSSFQGSEVMTVRDSMEVRERRDELILGFGGYRYIHTLYSATQQREITYYSDDALFEVGCSVRVTNTEQETRVERYVAPDPSPFLYGLLGQGYRRSPAG